MSDFVLRGLGVSLLKKRFTGECSMLKYYVMTVDQVKEPKAVVRLVEKLLVIFPVLFIKWLPVFVFFLLLTHFFAFIW